MTRLMILSWLATAFLLVVTLAGPRRWYRAVTHQVRPDRPEPTPDGYFALTVRNVVVTVAALVLVVPWSVDRLRLTDEELLENVQAVTDLVPEDELGVARLEAELTDRLGREVFVDDVTDETVEAGVAEEPDPAGGVRTAFLEVSTVSRDDRDGYEGTAGTGVEPDFDHPTVCVELSISRLALEAPSQTLLGVDEGRCDVQR